MDTHPDDLSDLERRLSAWQPAAQGLDADAMLFAAGRASRPRRLFWPAMTMSLAALVVALGAWALRERSDRLALAEQVRQQQAPDEPSPPPIPAAGPSTTDEPAPDSLFVARRALEHGLDAWPPRPVVAAGPPAPEPPVLRLGQRDALLQP